jgi:molecular chaperone DnaK
MYPIGIDFGTTRLKIACVDPSGKPIIILNDRGQPFTPAYLYFSESGEVLVGIDALEQGYIDPTRCVRNFKLKLGTTENLLGNGQVIDPTDAATIALEHLKKMAEEQLGIQVGECVLTCPANFRDDGKQALLEAAERAGLEVLKLVHEPMAAGFAYSLNKGGDKKYLVFDWGGGTFDVAVQHVQGPKVTTLATEGIHKLGGNDLNECINKRVLAEMQSKFGAVPEPDKEPLFFLDIDLRVEAAKISLNNRKKVPIVAQHNGNQTIVEISHEEFHRDIEHLIQQSLDAVDKAIAAAGLTMNDIDHVVMVGGTSRIPHIQNKVADHTGLHPKTDVDPDKAIAYGAALISIIELQKKGKTVKFRGQVIPTPEMFACDVTAHGVGCCVVDNSAPRKRLRNAVIIAKNTPIPCQRSNQFYLECKGR